MKYFYQLILILTTVVLTACGRQTARQQDDGDTVAFRYAEKIRVVRHQGYTEVTLANPWKKDKVLHRYLLVPKGEAVDALPEGTVVRVPLQRAVVFTTVHCALLQMLHQEQRIAGVADLKYIKVPYIHEQVREGRIMDCGDAMSPVIEKIIDLHPDAIFLSPFENSGGYGKVEDIDVPIVECAEYMESTPLGRAEWVRFYGMLFGCEHQADSLFAVVDSSYHALQQLVGKQRRKAMLDKVTGSVWYVPGGRSTIGQMLRDAGADYPWADDEHSGSVSLPFETVLEKAGECDVWLFRFSSDHLITFDELLSEHHGYDQFRAFLRREAYGCNVERSLFYEETPFRPDLLLGDFIRILHPDIPNLPPLRYYQKVQ
jgi:iron complex transport system substrate-binding protein